MGAGNGYHLAPAMEGVQNVTDDSPGRGVDPEAYLRIWGVLPEESPAPMQTQSAVVPGSPKEGRTLPSQSEQLDRLNGAVESLRQTVELLSMKTQAQNDSIQQALSELMKRIEDLDTPSGPSTLQAYGQD